MFKLHTWLLIGGFLLAVPGVRAQDLPQQEGVEVLARGPVHEAFAEPAVPNPAATPVVPREPPALIEEMPAEQRPDGDNVQWIPGYWAWDEDRGDFLWVSGIWRVPPPGRQWVPGHWNQVEGGWQWVPGFWAGDEQTQLSYLPPPPEPVVAAPSLPAPGPDSVAVPGTWVYRENHYLWRPSYWLAYRPGWVWVPAHYVWTPCGYVFVEGYWDYALRDRGLLFAPVAVDLRVCAAPRWFYQPRYVVQDDCLQAALFVRPGWGHYYFGDYFDSRYGRLGFTSWVDFGDGRRGWDPLFSYYRWDHRNDRAWESGLRDLYTARFRGDAPRPPRTLLQQTTVVNNINNTTISKNVNVTNVRNVAMLAPLSSSGARLRTVTPEQRLADQQVARQFQALGKQRAQLETQVLAKGPDRSASTPRLVTVDLPKLPGSRSSSGTRTPPPSPVRAASKSAGPAAPTARPQPAGVRGSELKTRQPEVNPAPAARPSVPVPAPRERPATTGPARPQTGATQPETRRPQPGAINRPDPPAEIRRSLPSPATRTVPPPASHEAKPAPVPMRPEARPPVPNRPAARPMPEPAKPAPKVAPAPARPEPKPVTVSARVPRPAPAPVRPEPKRVAVSASARPAAPAPQVKPHPVPAAEARRPSVPAGSGHAAAQPAAKGATHTAASSGKGKSRG